MHRLLIPSLEHLLGNIRDIASFVILTLKIDNILQRFKSHDCDKLNLVFQFDSQHFDCFISRDFFCLDTWQYFLISNGKDYQKQSMLQ